MSLVLKEKIKDLPEIQHNKQRTGTHTVLHSGITVIHMSD